MNEGSKSSLRSVLWALGGNSLVAALKYAAAVFTGSSALLAEANHSAGDVTTQFWLLVGIIRGKQPPTATFPHGYGKERYFWNVIATTMYLALSAITLYTGIRHFIGGHIPDYLTSDRILFTIDGLNVTPVIAALTVLAVSGIIELRTFFIAKKEVWEQKQEKTLKEYLRETTDPTAITVLFEDFFAVIGVSSAIGMIWLTYLTQNPLWDAAASITIGVIMAFTALFMGNLNRILIVGRSHTDTAEDIKKILEEHPGIEQFGEIHTEIHGVRNVSVKVKIEPREEELFKELTNGTAAKHFLRRLLDERGVEAIMDEVDDLTDEIERIIRSRCPEVQDVTVEVEQFDEEMPTNEDEKAQSSS